MNKDYIAIICKRASVNKRGEYKLVPKTCVDGELIKKENGNLFFKTEDKEFQFVNNLASLNDEYVFSFPCNKQELNEKLEVETNLDFSEMIFDAYLLAIQDYHFFQKKDVLGNLENFVFKKYVKTVHKYNPEKLLDSFVRREFEGEYDEFDEFEEYDDYNSVVYEVARPQKKATVTKKIENDTQETKMDIKNLYIQVTKSVLGQDENIRQIVSAIGKNQVINNPRLKSNILIAGPTGVGKTEVFRVISKELGLPITIEDSTQYTVAGYVGKSVDEMLVNLLINAGDDLPKAERGILVVDEIDKKAGGRGEEKIATSGVLESLLKIMEGGVIQIEYKRSRVPFNTSNLTFVAMGAFSGLEKVAKNPKPVGFGAEAEPTLGKFSTENFDRYGILPEFVGRCNTRVFFNDLDFDMQRKILDHSDCSPILLNKELFNDYGVKLSFTDGALDAIAKESIKLKTGARGLATITNYALSDVLFKIQTEPIYKEAYISQDTIYDNQKYELKRLNKKTKKQR